MKKIKLKRWKVDEEFMKFLDKTILQHEANKILKVEAESLEPKKRVTKRPKNVICLQEYKMHLERVGNNEKK